MDELMLTAERRTVLGKQVKRLRREGRVPGIVYGPVVTENTPVTVDRREFERFYHANGHATLFTLRWDGGEQTVFIREVQEDPIKRQALHVDFFAPNLLKSLRTMVPVALHNPNPEAQGVLTQLRTEVEVEGLPRDIPHQIDVDLSGLVNVGDAVRVGDLTLPRGITAATDPDELLAHLSAETVVEPEVAEEIEAEEGEPAEAEAAAEPGEAAGGDVDAAGDRPEAGAGAES
jgi:large subunit ribosomal protein L25